MIRVQGHDLVTGRGIKTGLPRPLVGGMELGTPEMPVAAVGRTGRQNTAVELSYALARGCVKLLESDVQSVEIIGSGSTPTGVHVVLSNGKSHAWVVSEDTGSGRALSFRGMPFSGPVVNYNLGLCLGLFMMLHRDNYPDFSAAVGKAVSARGEDSAYAQAIVLMADEMAFAVEAMLRGDDPLGTDCILMDREQPAGCDIVFPGGEELKTAFSSPEGFTGLTSSVLTACNDAPTSRRQSFVGELPGKLIDCIIRGKHVLLTGPTATGKTMAVEEACLQIGAPLVTVKGCEGLEDRDLIGATTIVTETTETGIASKTCFTYGPVSEAMILGRRQYEKHIAEGRSARRDGREPTPVPPAVLLVDEVNRLQVRHQNFLVSMLNVRKAASDYYLKIPDTNEEITCPDGFLVVTAARNMGSAFAGVNAMDLALERRFYKKIDLSYLPPEQEALLVQARTGLDEKLTRVLIKVAQDTRFQLSQLKAPLDTDTLLKWAEELAYLQGKGTEIADRAVLDVARDVVFDVVLERSERGGFDPAGEAVLKDNISESWRDVAG